MMCQTLVCLFVFSPPSGHHSVIHTTGIHLILAEIPGVGAWWGCGGGVVWVLMLVAWLWRGCGVAVAADGEVPALSCGCGCGCAEPARGW